MLALINQIFEISQKVKQNSFTVIDRNLRRIFFELEEKGYQIINPIGRIYKDTDADIEANISTKLTSKSKVIKVLKPIVYLNENGQNQLIQKAITIVE